MGRIPINKIPPPCATGNKGREIFLSISVDTTRGSGISIKLTLGPTCSSHVRQKYPWIIHKYKSALGAAGGPQCVEVRHELGAEIRAEGFYLGITGITNFPVIRFSNHSTSVWAEWWILTVLACFFAFFLPHLSRMQQFLDQTFRLSVI